MIWLIVVLAVIGHLGIWAAIFNQIHATAFARPKRKFLEKTILMMVFLPMIYVAWIYWPWNWFGYELDFSSQRLPREMLTTPWQQVGNGLALSQTSLIFYICLCLPIGAVLIARWAYRKLTQLPTKRLTNHQTQSLDVRQSIRVRDFYHGWFAKMLGLIPINQSHQLCLESYTFQLDLAEPFHGLKICHLSDLHLTGFIDRSYFTTCFQQIQSFEPDMIVITGDLVDTDDCIDWLPELLGDLSAPMGKFFILGNHDLRVKDQQRYLKQMESLGWIHLFQQPFVIKYQGGMICLAGNELPWYRGADDFSLPAPKATNELRILLSHSPDQIGWAKRFDFDLMLAGHNHGGQIRFPIVGAVISPSHYGVKYASGTFEIENLLLHVSRGLSGDKPIRIGCPPEIGLITLMSDNG